MHGDQLVLGQIGPFNLALAGQRMIASAGQHEGIFGQHVEIEIRIVGAHEVDAELDFATLYRLQAFGGRDIQDPEAHVGMRFVETRHHAGQEVERRRGQAGDGDGSAPRIVPAPQ